MKQEHHHLGDAVTAQDVNLEPAGRRDIKPWQTPELLEADYSITADGTKPGGDRFGLAIS
jgi:hypothetical protein